MYQYWNDKEIDNIKFVSRNVFIFWYTELIAKIINQISNQIQANKNPMMINGYVTNVLYNN